MAPVLGIAHRALRKMHTFYNRTPTAMAVFLSRLPKRSDLDFATHIPVLVGLSRLLNVRKVLELGCGQYSTLTFLDRRAFPDLISLDSYESDAAWFAQMQLMTADRRLALRLTSVRMEAGLESDLNKYDLIFVDNGADYADRAVTIHLLSKLNPRTCVTVVHDFQSPSYRTAANNFSHCFEMRAFNPSTGVAWKDASLKIDQLQDVNAVISTHANKLAPDDIEGWADVFNRIL